MPVIRKSRLVIFHPITPTALKKPFNKTQIPINKQVSMPIAMWKPGMYMSFLYFKLSKSLLFYASYSGDSLVTCMMRMGVFGG